MPRQQLGRTRGIPYLIVSKYKFSSNTATMSQNLFGLVEHEQSNPSLIGCEKEKPQPHRQVKMRLQNVH